MAEADVLEELQELNTCTVCMEIFNERDPRVLRCLHVFCYECITQVYETSIRINHGNRGKVECPNCRKYTHLFQNAIDNLPKSFQSKSLQDAIDKLKSKKVVHNCDVCDTEKVTGFCFSCSRMLCNSCETTHNSRRRYQSHAKVKVTSDTISSLCCTVHNKYFECFCTTCSVPVCKLCQIANHKEHELQDFCVARSLSAHHKASDISFLVKQFDQINKIQDEFNAHMHSVGDSILHQRVKLLEQIETQTKDMSEKMTKHQTEVNKSLNTQKTDIQNFVQQPNAACKQLAEQITPLPSFPHITIQNKVSPFPEHILLSEPKRYTFTTETEAIVLGQLAMSPESNTTDPKLCEDCLHGRVKKSNEENVGRTEQTLQQEMSDKPYVRIMFQADSTGSSVCDIGSLPSGELLILTKNSRMQQLVLKDKFGEAKTMPFGVSSMNDLVAISIHVPTSKIAVLHNEHKHYLMKTHQPSFTLFCLENWLWNRRKTYNVEGRPDAMTFTPDGDLILSGNQTLTKYRSDGTKVWQRVLSHECQRLTVDKDNRIIAPHYNQAVITVYDEHGDKIFTFPHTIDKHVLELPSSVCTDSQCNILVADYIRQSVCMFSFAGKYLKELAKLEGRPTCISLLQDKFLVIGTEQGHMHILSYEK